MTTDAQRGAARAVSRVATVLVATLTASIVAPGIAMAAAAPGYQVTPGPERTLARFVVSYAGHGSYRTVYHATPPNKGGAHDTNDATDSSSQRWVLRFGGVLTIPSCQPQAGAASDPCQSMQGLSGAGGVSRLTAGVKHVHRDGLFKSLNAGIKCQIARRERIPIAPAPTLRIGYMSANQTLSVTASDPLSVPIERFPSSCPSQGDSLDGLLDNYFTPGFSFAPGYGPDRWFTATSVAIPLAVLHRAARVTIRLHAAPAGIPPRDCAVAHPSYERCRTGGSWSGVLTLRAVA